MIDNDPDIGVCMSWEEENPPEDVPPVSYVTASNWQHNSMLRLNSLYILT